MKVVVLVVCSGVSYTKCYTDLQAILCVCFVISDVLVKMPYVDGELPVYWWDSEADRCMVIGIFRHGRYLFVSDIPYLLSMGDLAVSLTDSVCYFDSLA